MSMDNKPNEGHQAEVLQTLFLTQNNLEDYVLGNALLKDARLRKHHALVHQAQKALSELYHEIANLSFPMQTPSNGTWVKPQDYTPVPGKIETVLSPGLGQWISYSAHFVDEQWIQPETGYALDVRYIFVKAPNPSLPPFE